MDNLCHTLVGAAMGRAGLARRTGLGMATLMIGANFPDLDVVAVPLGHSLEYRRGWTHGVLALALLPFLLTGLMLLWDRWRRRGGRVPEDPVLPRQILLLATLSILSHPLLDWMNTYGMRWLMPFSGRWFYGDAFFIVDPWIWTALAAGVIAARRGTPRGARLALAGLAAYGALMLAGSAAGRRLVRAELAAAGEPPPASVMVGPVPIDPLRRDVVADLGDGYRFGTLRWTPAPRLELDPEILPRNADHPAVRAAAAAPEARGFLVWSRFPYFVVEERGGRTVVRMDDARYASRGGRSFAGVEVVLP